MNRELEGDVRFFLAMVVFGAAAALVYDMLRVLRRLRKQSLFTVSLQDFVYWFATGLVAFRVIYRYNAGVLRLFVFVGAGLGAVLYRALFSRFFVTYCVKLLRILFLPMEKGLLFLKKQGKLIKKAWSAGKERRDRERKDVLATKEQEKSKRSGTAFDDSVGHVRRTDLQQRAGRRKGKRTKEKEDIRGDKSAVGERTTGGA